MISEVKSLSTKVAVSKTFETVDNNQYGKIYVSVVSVVYEKKKLCVIQKVCTLFDLMLRRNINKQIKNKYVHCIHLPTYMYKRI